MVGRPACKQDSIYEGSHTNVEGKIGVEVYSTLPPAERAPPSIDSYYNVHVVGGCHLPRNKIQVEDDVRSPESMTLLGQVKDDLEIGGLMHTRGHFIRLKCNYNVHRLDNTPETTVKESA